MSKLLITTQVYENYGDADQPYWKPKGGSDYVVKNIDVNRANDIVNLVSGEIECDNEMFREYLIGWEVVANDYLPDYERCQLEFEGKIVYPVKELCV